MERSRCAQCLAAGEVRKCGRCGVCAYCGPACQKLHWAEHKPECGFLAAWSAALGEQLGDAVLLARALRKGALADLSGQGRAGQKEPSDRTVERVTVPQASLRHVHLQHSTLGTHGACFRATWRQLSGHEHRFCHQPIPTSTFPAHSEDEHAGVIARGEGGLTAYQSYHERFALW